MTKIVDSYKFTAGITRYLMRHPLQVRNLLKRQVQEKFIV